MTLWWSIAPLVLVAGIGLLAVVFARLRAELDQLDESLIRLERVGVGVDELRREVRMVNQQTRRVQISWRQSQSPPR